MGRESIAPRNVLQKASSDMMTEQLQSSLTTGGWGRSEFDAALCNVQWC